MSWEFAEGAPSPFLLDHVRNYTGYSERTEGPLCRREVPSGDVMLILSPGSELRTPERHTSFVAALHDRPSLVAHDGFQEGLQVRLSPLGARAVFGVPMHELSNRVIEVDEVFGRTDLVDRLFDAQGWERRFEIVDNFLAERVARSGPAPGELRWAWRSLCETQGRVGAGALAAELGWSHRRLIGRFRDQIGMPPKAVARVLRFERASRVLMRGPDTRLAELALDCGYYDQAHLNRDFRAFAGVTPTEYMARRLPDLGGVGG